MPETLGLNWKTASGNHSALLYTWDKLKLQFRGRIQGKNWDVHITTQLDYTRFRENGWFVTTTVCLGFDDPAYVSEEHFLALSDLLNDPEGCLQREVDHINKVVNQDVRKHRVLKVLAKLEAEDDW